MVSGDALELKEGDEARERGRGCVTSSESTVSSSGGSGLRRGIPVALGCSESIFEEGNG
jgi:hypothetical protein